MNTKTSWKRFVIVVTLGVAFLGVPVYSAVSKANAADLMIHSELSGGPSVTAVSAPDNDAITVWNQQAVTLTLLPASALAPVQQTRVMAIVQVAVHDAVNGITGKYETYVSPGAAPENASPVAAAIAAAHHALRNLFNTSPTAIVMLDTLYATSLAAHELPVDDPGIALRSLRRRRNPGVACQR